MNLEHMYIGEKLAKLKPQIKKIFFYRICGTGMGACACLAREAGFEIAGADLTFSPPMSTYLADQNIDLLPLTDVTAELLKEYDLIIVGNSVPRMSEYARFIENSGVAFTSFPAFLGEFLLKDREVIGIAGTHGKTTTTYFMTQLLEKCGEDAGYLVGGILNESPPSKLGTSPYFVIESDEYDSAYFQKISKFRLYELTHMILTSLEFDHADIFDSIEDIKNEFAAILNKWDGEIIANDEYPAIKELAQKYPHSAFDFYGLNSSAGPHKIETLEGITSFTLTWQDRELVFKTNIVGTHNILNLSSCILFLLKKGFSPEDLQKGCLHMGLVKRRQEFRGYYQGTVVIDDFAHHPRAIDLTIDAIKTKYPGKRLITVFEPISATARSSLFQKEFADALKKSDKVILAMNSLQTTVKSQNNLDGIRLQTDISQAGVECMLADNLSSLQKHLDQHTGEENLFLILSNRTCLGLWESEFVKNLL